jgi:hypothetical protein
VTRHKLHGHVGNKRNIRDIKRVRTMSIVGVFSPTRYRVVRITCSSSEVVLQTIKHTIVYPGSGPTLEVIALHSIVSY